MYYSYKQSKLLGTMTRAAIQRVVVFLIALVLVSVNATVQAEEKQHEHDKHNNHKNHSSDPGQLIDKFMQDTDGQTCKIPEADLLSVEGLPVQLYKDFVKSKTVAVSLIYTECTTICAPITANFAQVSESLGDRIGQDIQLVSISIDPVTDTPARLKEWSAYFEPPSEGWVFLTGEKHKVDRLLKGLKVFTPNLYDHPPVMIVANDQTGECVYTNGLAAPDQIKKIIVDLADQAPKS